jgi:signal transduction histidine kinase
LPIFSEISSSNRSSQSVVSSLKSISSGNDDQQAIFVAAKEQGFLGYKGNGWILIMAVPTQVAFKEVSQLRTNVILVAIAILASAIIAVIVFSKLVTEPLVKLKNVASEIAKGNFDVSAKVDSNDEIGELSRQFEKMKIDLRDRERLKDEFINIAAHELRSPLQPIISYNELALKGLIDKDEALKIIDIESQRFIQLANDILDVTRIEGGALTYQIQKVRLVDIIGRIVSSAKISSNLSNETTIELVTDEQSKGIEVDADINRLSQVFMNIIGNAVKFTRKGKIKISISAHPAQNEIEISVVDSGGGIPKDILPHLFGKFVTRSVKGGTEHGTGLGLFISKAIVLAHGGRIYGSNNSEGGATFTIFLPIKATKNIIINNGDNET